MHPRMTKAKRASWAHNDFGGIAKFHQFNTRVQVEFAHDPFAMTGDGLRTQFQFFANSLRLPACSQVCRHFYTNRFPNQTAVS
jgi:hypothetical protein